MPQQPPLHIVSSPEAVWQQPGLPLDAAPGPCNLLSTGRHRHEWEGFGGCFNELGWDALQRLDPAARREILDGLFGEEVLHLEIGRLPMGASDYALSWHSYDETDGDLELSDFSIERDRERLFPFVKEALARRPGVVFTRYQIVDAVKGEDYPVTDRSVDVQIVGLRKKLKKYGKLIETVRGVGYRFSAQARTGAA